LKLFLVEGGGLKLSLGDENLEIDLRWTRGDSYLKDLSWIFSFLLFLSFTIWWLEHGCLKTLELGAHKRITLNLNEITCSLPMVTTKIINSLHPIKHVHVLTMI
jgi:hypothetical protein